MAESFSVSTDHLRVSSEVRSVTPMTIGAWFYSTDADNVQVIVDLADGTGDRYRLALRGNVAGDPVAAMTCDVVSCKWADSTTGYSTNTWQHACGVFAADDSRKVFLDGGNTDTEVSSKTTASLGEATVGSSSSDDSGKYVRGSVAEVGIWDIALSDAEVLELAAGYSPLCVRPDSLVAYWPLVGRYSPEISLINATHNLTVTGATASAHPRIIYPTRQRFSFPVAAPPAGGVGTRMLLTGVGA